MGLVVLFCFVFARTMLGIDSPVAAVTRWSLKNLLGNWLRIFFQRSAMYWTEVGWADGCLK